jgi:SAM-dependent methyltransferase
MSKNLLKFKKAVHSFIKELKAEPGKPPYAGDKYHCPVCNTDIAYFKHLSFDVIEKLDKYQHALPFFMLETLNIINYECPHCGAGDRDRLYAMYFDKNFAGSNKKYNLLDIAPSPLKGYLKSRTYLNYRSADLYMPGVDDQVDLTDMNIYEEGKFDIFICSHVLEHIKEEKKAISELFRVLKPGGWGIAVVPINLALEDTVEDDKYVSEADRWKYYGQDDHVRMYSKKGFIRSLQAGGFKVSEYGIDYFGKEQFEKNGINPRSILYIVNKP